MKSLKNIALLLFVSVLLLISCKKSSDSPSATSLGVQIQATNKSFSLLKSATLATPSFTWDTSFINVSKIEFDAEKRESEVSHDSSEMHLEWTGPKKIDLFNLNSIVGSMTLQPGIYDEISVKVIAYKADAGNSPVFYLSGSYTNSSGTAIPIVIIVNEDFMFKVKLEGSQLDAVNDYSTLINLNLSKLMANVLISDLTAASLTNGKIIISSTSNVALYDKINTNVSTCAESEVNKGKDSGSSHGNDSNSGSGSGSDMGNGNGSGSGNGYGYGY